MAPGNKQNNKLKLFVSYSRRNSEIADTLVAALEQRGFEVMIDRRDLPFGEKWQSELVDFIRASDTVLWLISEHSVESKWCNWELDEVIKRNKRLVPVMVADTPRDQLPRQLGAIHILPPHGEFDLARDLNVLVTTLETDHAWLKEHTRLADRAREWIANNNVGSLLLRGAALQGAERWERSQPATAPTPASEVLELILASRQAATRRQRYWVGGSLIVSAGAVALASLAYLQSIEADRQRAAAEIQREQAVAAKEAEADQRKLAQDNEARALAQEGVAKANEARAKQERDTALRTQSLFLADLAGQNSKQNNHGIALALALEALPESIAKPDRPFVPEAELALSRALNALPSPGQAKILPFGEPSAIISAGLHAHGTRAWALTEDMVVRQWDLERSTELAQTRTGLSKHDLETLVYRGVTDRENIKIIIEDRKSKTLRAFDVASGKVTSTMHGLPSFLTAFVWAPESSRLLTISDGVDLQIWNVNNGELIADNKSLGFVPFYEEAVATPDGRYFLIRGQRKLGPPKTENGVRVFNLYLVEAKSGRVERTLKDVPLDGISAVSADGTKIIVNTSGLLDLWNLKTEKLIASKIAQAGTSAHFTPNNDFVAVGNADGAISLIELKSQRVHKEFRTSGSYLEGLSVDPTGTRLIAWSKSSNTFDKDTRLEVWSIDETKPLQYGSLLNTFDFSAGGPVLGIDFIKDTSSLVVFQKEGRVSEVALSAKQGTIVLKGHKAAVREARFSPDGKAIVSIDQKNEMRLWQQEAERFELVGSYPGEVKNYGFNRDGTYFATGANDGLRVRRTSDGKEIFRIEATKHATFIHDARLSLDGRYLLISHIDAVAKDPSSSVSINLIDIETQSSNWQARGFATATKLIQFVPDNSAIIVVFNDRSVRLIDKGDGSELQQIERLPGTTASWINRTGEWLGMVSSNRTHLYRYDSKSRKLKLDQELLYSLQSGAFSHAGDRVVIPRQTGKQKIVEFFSGKEIIETGPEQGVASAELSPDKQSLLIASYDKTVQVWPVFRTSQEHIDYARKRLPRCLTAKERKQFFLDPNMPAWCGK